MSETLKPNGVLEKLDGFERKSGTPTREPDSDNADVGKNLNYKGKASEFGDLPLNFLGGNVYA